jgi:hypothetical protein
MQKRIIVFTVLLLVIIMMAGCKDITDSFRPGSFGSTPEEVAMVEAITERYGDLTQGGEPRFLEVMMTTRVDNAIPTDMASKYSKDTEKLYVWFVYDNFDKDIITIEWIYLDNDYSIHTFEAETGEDFGRGTFILEQPEDGWPTGKYKVILSGRGIQETVSFEIIEGATVATAIPFESGKIALPTKAGWHLSGTELVIADVDVTKVKGGRIEGRVMGTVDLIYDYFESKGGKNDFYYEHRRTSQNGKLLHSGYNHTKWNDPPNYIAPGEKVDISINKVGEGWGVSKCSVSIDFGNIMPGYATSSGFKFRTTNGETHFDNYEGTITSEKVMPTGKAGDERAIIFTIGDGYGFRYIYKWQD